MRRPGLIGRVAELFQGAVYAARLTRNADLAAVIDQLMRKVDPTVLGDDLHQVLLDLLRRGLGSQLQALR